MMLWRLWLALWCAVIGIAGYVLVQLPIGSDGRVGVGALVAIGFGIGFALLSKLVRRLLVAPGTVHLHLQRWGFVPVWITIFAGPALAASWAFSDTLNYLRRPLVLLAIGGVVVSGLLARYAGKLRRYLLVDIAAHRVVYRGLGKPVELAIDEVGTIEVEPYRVKSGRHTLTWHRVRATGMPQIILSDMASERVATALQQRLQRDLDHYRDIAHVRRAIADAPTDDAGVFRTADVATRLDAAVPDRERRTAALAWLAAHDIDPAVRARAAS